MNLRRTAHERERMLSGGSATPAVRAPIRASWSRARRSGLRTDAYLPPVPLTDSDLTRLRDEHPLARVWPTLRRSLQGAVDDGNLLFLSDAYGHLLWVAGDHDRLRVGERVHLVPGARWSEATAGTSGVGTALALRRTFQVFGAEHFLSVATSYMCTAAPIRDPLTGRLLGAVDLTGGLRGSRAMTFALLTTAARLAENQLRAARLAGQARLQRRYADRVARRFGTHSALVAPDGQVVYADPAGWLPRLLPEPAEGILSLPDGRRVMVERLVAGGPFLVLPASRTDGGTAMLTFTGLGRDRALLRIGDVTHELSRRHGDIVALLLSRPEGFSAGALTRAVYGPAGKPVSLRAEINRLRAVLGGVLASDPYRIRGNGEADFAAIERDLDHEPVSRLLDRYHGPLLPASTAPGVVKLRERLHERLWHRVLASNDADAMTRWSAVTDY